MDGARRAMSWGIWLPPRPRGPVFVPPMRPQAFKRSRSPPSNWRKSGRGFIQQAAEAEDKAEISKNVQDALESLYESSRSAPPKDRFPSLSAVDVLIPILSRRVPSCRRKTDGRRSAFAQLAMKGRGDLRHRDAGRGPVPARLARRRTASGGRPSLVRDFSHWRGKLRTCTPCGVLL
jgi:hypothetical protein